MGAIRCFYTCIKAQELQGAALLNLYPALIEFIHEYLEFINQELKEITNSSKFLSLGKSKVSNFFVEFPKQIPVCD